MEKKNDYLALKKKYEQLQEQSLLILKEQTIILEKLEKICPHTETSEPFEDNLYAFQEVKVCKVCKKTLHYDLNEQTWK